MFQLAQGNSAETSGGLLICLPREQATAYCKDIQKVEGYQAWIIGIVEKGNRYVFTHTYKIKFKVSQSIFPFKTFP